MYGVSLVKEGMPVRSPGVTCSCQCTLGAVLTQLPRSSDMSYRQGPRVLWASETPSYMDLSVKLCRVWDYVQLYALYKWTLQKHEAAGVTLQCGPPDPDAWAWWWEPMGTFYTCRWHPRDAGWKTKDSVRFCAGEKQVPPSLSRKEGEKPLLLGDGRERDPGFLPWPFGM